MKFAFPGLRGGIISLEALKGRAVLIVNTASQCGFTPQYAGLESLWQRHKADGLMVIGVPSNQFGRQEPGSADEIGQFCQVNYGVTFPMAAKTLVTGPEAHPLFRWFAREGGFWAKPRWNFWKFLVGPDGRLAASYSSLTAPSSGAIARAVAALLPQR